MYAFVASTIREIISHKAFSCIVLPCPYKHNPLMHSHNEIQDFFSFKHQYCIPKIDIGFSLYSTTILFVNLVRLYNFIRSFFQ